MLKLLAFSHEGLLENQVGLPALAIRTLGLQAGEPIALSVEGPRSDRLTIVPWVETREVGPDGCLLPPHHFHRLQLEPGQAVSLTSARLPQPWFWTFFWDFQEPETRFEDLLLLLDTSGSMKGRPLQAAKRAIYALLDRKRERTRCLPGSQEPLGDRVGLLTFGGEGLVGVRLPCPPARGNEARLINAVQQCQASGRTPMAEALSRALDILGELTAENDRRRRLILVTDGHPCPGSSDEVAILIPRLAAARIRVATVGVGDSFDRDLLARLAAGTQAPFVEVQRIRELLYTLEDLA